MMESELLEKYRSQRQRKLTVAFVPNEEPCLEEQIIKILNSPSSHIGFYVYGNGLDSMENMSKYFDDFLTELKENDCCKYRIVSEIRTKEDLQSELKKSVAFDVVIFENADTFLFDEEFELILIDALTIKDFYKNMETEIKMKRQKLFFLTTQSLQKAEDMGDSIYRLMGWLDYTKRLKKN